MPVLRHVLLRIFLLVAACGWLAAAQASEYAPSTADSAEIQQLSARYFEHLDRKEYDAVYAMFTDGMRATAPFGEWRTFMRESQRDWGTLTHRGQTNITWYNDPPNAPRPGLYVAVDYVSRYANLAQHTEFLVWYRERDGMPFALTRHETNAVDKASAAKGAPHPGATPGKIPYPNVETARAALLARDDIDRSEVDGWTIIKVPAENAIWSFTPASHPAHPSMILRAPFERDGTVYLGMDVKCGATKPVCDALVEEFMAMNARMAEDMQRSREEDRKP
ncbi:MAG: DUF4019 domain-containing protein [Pseudomonadota bacterium]